MLDEPRDEGYPIPEGCGSCGHEVECYLDPITGIEYIDCYACGHRETHTHDIRPELVPVEEELVDLGIIAEDLRRFYAEPPF